MADVVINSGKTGRLERQYDTEAEMLGDLLAWVIAHGDDVVGYVQIGAEDLFSFPAYSIYRVECGPGADNEGYLRIRWVGSS